MRVDPADPMRFYRSEDTPEFDDADAARRMFYCSICRMDVAPGTKHCRRCDKCVAGFDHHCAWLNTCVGARNIATFRALLAVAFVCLLSLAVAAASAVLFSIVFVAAAEDAPACLVRSRVVAIAVSAATCVLSVVLAMFLLRLLRFHRFLKAQGLTTYAFIRQQASYRRRCRNCPCLATWSAASLPPGHALGVLAAIKHSREVAGAKPFPFLPAFAESESGSSTPASREEARTPTHFMVSVFGAMPFSPLAGEGSPAHSGETPARGPGARTV